MLKPSWCSKLAQSALLKLFIQIAQCFTESRSNLYNNKSTSTPHFPLVHVVTSGKIGYSRKTIKKLCNFIKNRLNDSIESIPIGTTIMLTQILFSACIINFAGGGRNQRFFHLYFCDIVLFKNTSWFARWNSINVQSHDVSQFKWHLPSVAINNRSQFNHDDDHSALDARRRSVESLRGMYIWKFSASSLFILSFMRDWTSPSFRSTQPKVQKYFH